MIHKLKHFLNSLTLDRAIKLSIVSGILLISLAIFYYLVIFIPHREQAKLDQQKQQQTEADRQARLNSLKLSGCLDAAQGDYSANWASNCKSNAVAKTTGYNNCLNEAYMTAATCASVWGSPDDSPNCSLPTALANSLDDGLKNARDECYKRYPQK